MKSKSRIFKTRKEEKAWLHAHMLTVGKLIQWLKKHDPDALIYRFETNTGDWQEIPGDIDKSGLGWIETVAQGKARDKKYFESLYKGTENSKDKVKASVKSTYKYTEPNGILIRL